MKLKLISGGRDDSNYPEILSSFNECVDNAITRARNLESLHLYENVDGILRKALMNAQDSALKPADLREGLKQLIEQHEALVELAKGEVETLSADDFGFEYGMLRDILGEDKRYEDMPEVTSIRTFE